MPKLTATQLAALALIEGNPDLVEAITRIAKGTKRINGNAENKLRQLGLIEKSTTFRVLGTYVYSGQEVQSIAYFWQLTQAGRDALRAASAAA